MHGHGAGQALQLLVSYHTSLYLPSAQQTHLSTKQGLTEVREGAHLQGIRSLHAWLHFQPTSCLFRRLNHERSFGISSPIHTRLLEKERIREKGVPVHYTAASSQSVPSYKFTSQTLTRAGVSCVCSLGSCPFEVLQCWGEGWPHRLDDLEVFYNLYDSNPGSRWNQTTQNNSHPITSTLSSAFLLLSLLSLCQLAFFLLPANIPALQQHLPLGRT